jgi:hypothetical protein
MTNLLFQTILQWAGTSVSRHESLPEFMPEYIT